MYNASMNPQNLSLLMNHLSQNQYQQFQQPVQRYQSQNTNGNFQQPQWSKFPPVQQPSILNDPRQQFMQAWHVNQMLSNYHLQVQQQYRSQLPLDFIQNSLSAQKEQSNQITSQKKDTKLTLPSINPQQKSQEQLQTRQSQPSLQQKQVDQNPRQKAPTPKSRKNKDVESKQSSDKDNMSQSQINAKSSKQLIQLEKISQTQTASKTSKEPKKRKEPKKAKEPSVKAIKQKVYWNKLRVFRIRLHFIALYIFTLRQLVAAKRVVQIQELNDTAAEALEESSNWIDESLGDIIIDFLNSRDDLSLVLGKEDINTKSRLYIATLLKKIMASLKKNITKLKTLTNLLSFLNMISMPYKYPPQKYYLNFEHNRLTFTDFGSIGNISKDQSILILMTFIIIRGLLTNTLMQAWQYHPNQDNQSHLLLIQRNSIIVCSVLHSITISYLQKKVKRTNQDITLIKRESQIIPRQKPLSDDTVNVEGESPSRLQETVLVLNLMNESTTQRYLVDKSKNPEKWIAQVIEEQVSICESIYSFCLEHANKQKSNTTKERMIMMMNATNEILQKTLVGRGRKII